MNVSVTKALTQYFNEGDGKRPAKDWLAELKQFSPEEKRALALEVCAVNGWTLED